MSTESESAKAVSKALMVSMELEQEFKQIVTQRNALLEVLQKIIEACEECDRDDGDLYRLDNPSDTVTLVRQLALDGLLSSSD